MRCKCGYVFSGTDRKFESFAVIHDRDYQAFLESERQVSAAGSEAAKLKAVLHSSQFVGSLMECPRCSRTLFLKPGAADWVFFRREE